MAPGGWGPVAVADIPRAGLATRVAAEPMVEVRAAAVRVVERVVVVMAAE
jgi:hypothetical protein